MPACDSIPSSAANATNIMNAGTVGGYPGALTPDALMIYLQTRLEGLDGQINDIFDQQQKFEKLRGLLSKIRNELNQLDDQGDPNALKGEAHAGTGAGVDDPAHAEGYEANIENLLTQIGDIDPSLAAQMRGDMRKEGQILYCEDGIYKGAEVSAGKDYIDSLMKDTEASAQMNMIKLQSSMSARQTAIQLSTNLVSALGESAKSIAGNIGR